MTITLQLTEEPSRSKQAGPCWVGVATNPDVARYEFATPATAKAPRSVDVQVDTVVRVAGVATLRRATRTSKDRNDVTYTVTGNPDDVVTFVVVPRYLEARITGVVES